MRKSCVLALALVVLVTGSAFTQAQTTPTQGDLEHIVKALDGAVVALRKGESATALISEASSVYSTAFSGLENVDNTLHTEITSAFSSISSAPAENAIFALKTSVLAGAGKLGVSLSPLHSYAIFFVLLVSILVSLGTTIVLKKTVNWALVNESNAKFKEYKTEYKDAVRKKDMKRIHKLDQRRQEMNKLAGIAFTQTTKPTLYFLVPLFALWLLVLGPTFGGWVVAWLPFNVNLPIVGNVVAFGIGWWYFITMIGFSSIFRSILIPESKPPLQVSQPAPPCN